MYRLTVKERKMSDINNNKSLGYQLIQENVPTSTYRGETQQFVETSYFPIAPYVFGIYLSIDENYAKKINSVIIEQTYQIFISQVILTIH